MSDKNLKRHLPLSLTTLGWLLMGPSAFSAMVRPLNDLTVIRVPISQRDVTRIAVKGDRISNVFGGAGDYVLETDETQGQIFIKPNGSKPISLTLTTEKGHTQDLQLLPKDQSPEALILRVEDEEAQAKEFKKQPFRENLSEVPLIRSEVEELLQACQQGRIPLGYKEIPLELNTLSQPYLLIREIRGKSPTRGRSPRGVLRGLTYEIRNLSTTSRVLSEAEFFRTCGLLPHEVIAIFIPKKTIAPREGGHIHVVARTK